jgi:hypothetical protein
VETAKQRRGARKSRCFLSFIFVLAPRMLTI